MKPGYGAALDTRAAPGTAGVAGRSFLSPFSMSAALLVPLLTAAGCAGFWLFFRSVDFFERI